MIYNMTINNHARVASFIVIGKFHFLSRIKVSFNFHLPLFSKWNGLKLRCKIPLRHNFISKGILNCYCAQLHLFCEKAATSIEIYHSIANGLRDSDWKAKMIKTCGVHWFVSGGDDGTNNLPRHLSYIRRLWNWSMRSCPASYSSENINAATECIVPA